MVKHSFLKVSLNTGFGRFLSIALATIFIYGCGTTPNQKSTKAPISITLGAPVLSSAQYLDKARMAGGITKQAYLLNALRAALVSGSSPDKQVATVLFNDLSEQPMLNDNHTMEWQWLQSIALNQSLQSQQALAILSPNKSWQVPASRWVAYYQYKGTLEENLGLNVEALYSLASAQNYSKSSDNLTLSQKIWSLISNLDDEQLTNLITTNRQLAGWKALAQITKSTMQSPTALRQQVTQWALDNPQHMAVDQLPENLVAALTIEAYAPKKIAVLLPLSGRYARLGQAVQHGIVANLMAHNTEQELVSYDTAALGAVDAYRQAIAQQADFVIGPLLKHHVAEVAALEQKLPILFLNSNNAPLQSNQFSFSLSKEAEAIEAVSHIHALGKLHPVIVAPNNAQGHKISRLFSQQWLELNKDLPTTQPIEAFYFDNDSQLKKTIEQLFETDKSQGRINHMRMLVGNKMLSETRSRRDIDAIYLVANPNQTGMLMPSVNVTVSAFASQVPVFVSSSGNDNLDNSQDRSHLNQLTISDMPWFIQPAAQLPPKYIKKLWPSLKQSQLRLFAMGHDAYGLITRLAQMQYFPQFTLQGFSGTLSLNKENDIIRQMAWAQYQRGKLIKQ